VARSTAVPHSDTSGMGTWRWRNVPLPEPLLGGLGAGIVLHVVERWRFVPAAWIGQAIGWPLVLAGSVLAIRAVTAAWSVDLLTSSFSTL
jgi:hypothetical protein